MRRVHWKYKEENLVLRFVIVVGCSHCIRTILYNLSHSQVPRIGESIHQLLNINEECEFTL